MSGESETPLSETPEFRRWVDGYNRLEKKLTSEGFKVDYCGGACPIQVGGWMPTGEYFYFRSRGEQVSLEVWTKNFEPKEEHMGWCPASKEDFFALHRPFTWPDAGWLPAHHLEKWLRRFFRMFRNWKKKPGPLPRIKRGWSLKKHLRMNRRWRKQEARMKRHG